MEDFQMGDDERPAFYFVVNNYDAEPGGFVCACRLERGRAEQVQLIIPNDVNGLFQPGAVADIRHIWFKFPNGFEVNRYDQQLDEAIWTGIVQQFLNEAAVQNFLSLNLE